jgi:hypothetical protein
MMSSVYGRASTLGGLGKCMKILYEKKSIYNFLAMKFAAQHDLY